MEGPAPLIVTASACRNSVLLDAIVAGIKCFLAGSMMASSIPFVIVSTSFSAKPATIGWCLKYCEQRLLAAPLLEEHFATSVFFFGTSSHGTAITRTRSLGGSSSRPQPVAGNTAYHKAPQAKKQRRYHSALCQRLRPRLLRHILQACSCQSLSHKVC